MLRSLFAIICIAAPAFLAEGCHSDRRESAGGSWDVPKPRVDPEPAVAAVIYGSEFDHDPTTDEVIQEAERRGFECPTYTEASKLSEDYGKHSGWRADGNPLLAVFFYREEIEVKGIRCVLLLICAEAFCGQGHGIVPRDPMHWPRDFTFVFMRRPKH